MTKWLVFLPVFMLVWSASAADSPLGEWQVADGGAHIRVMECGQKLWGIISWVKEPGTDSNNPDPTKRARPMVGVPIVLGMSPAEANRWEGDIYNSDNGKIYNGSVTLKSANTLHITGCLLGDFLCGGEDWTRVPVSSATFSCPSAH